jgi:hypothetical protein
MRGTRLAVVVAATTLAGGLCGGVAGAADPVWSGTATLSRSAPTGETVTVTMRWKDHTLGPGGGVPYTEYECEAQFSGPATSVAQKTSVVCYADNASGVGHGVATTAPGPAAVAVGAGERSFASRHCVQAITYYGSALVPASLVSPAWVLVPATCFA